MFQKVAAQVFGGNRQVPGAVHDDEPVEVVVGSDAQAQAQAGGVARVESSPLSRILDIDVEWD